MKWVAFGIDCVQVALDRAAKLIGRLAYNRAVKDAVRDAQVPFSHIHPCFALLFQLFTECLAKYFEHCTSLLL